MSALYRFCIRRPRVVLAMALAAVAAAAPGIPRLQIRTDGKALVPPDAPEVREDERVRAEFGLTDSIVLMIRNPGPGGIYHAATLRLVTRLTADLRALPGIRPDDVFSLATEKSHRVRTGTLQFLPLIDPIPETPAQLDTLRDDIRKNGLYDGTLVSDDAQATAIFVGVPPGIDRLALHRSIRGILEKLGPLPGEIRVTGAPVAESLLGTHILEDLGIPGAWLGDRVAPAPLESAGGLGGAIDHLRAAIAEHIGLLPVALVVMVLVFLASFRNWTAAIITLGKMGACLTIIFGAMGWIGVPIYLTIAVMPVILTAIGVSDEVHIFRHYLRRLRAEPGLPPARLLEGLMDELWRPVTLTSVTTALGFLSFALSPLRPVQAFGLCTAAGALVCMFWALTATPAMLVLIPAARFRATRGLPAPAGPSAGPGRLGRLGGLAAQDRRVVAAALVVILAASWWGIRRVRVQDSWIDGFSPRSEFFRATQAFNRHFLGMHCLYLCVDTGGEVVEGVVDEKAIEHFLVRLPSGVAADPAALAGQTMELSRPGENVRPVGVEALGPSSLFYRCRLKSARREGDSILAELDRTMGSPRFTIRIQPGERVRYRILPQRLLNPPEVKRLRDLERFVSSRGELAVGGALGPGAYLETTQYLAGGKWDQPRALPDRPDQLEWLWRWYGQIRGPQRFRATVNGDFSSGVICVYMRDANFVDTGRLLGELRDYEREHLSPAGMRLRFAGDVAVSQSLIQAIVRTQVRSLVVSILGVLVIAVLLNRSLWWGICCAIPCAVATPLNIGLMGWLGMPLGVATSMFTAMTIGIGDDYAIHLVERTRLALGRGRSPLEAVGESLDVAGPSVVVNALSVSIGFGVLLLSQVPSNARLGLMVMISTASCLVASLVLLPAAIALVSGRAAARRTSSPPGGPCDERPPGA